MNIVRTDPAGTVSAALGNIEHFVFVDLQGLPFRNDPSSAVLHKADVVQGSALADIPVLCFFEVELVEREIFKEYCIIHSISPIKTTEYYVVETEYHTFIFTAT